MAISVVEQATVPLSSPPSSTSSTARRGSLSSTTKRLSATVYPQQQATEFQIESNNALEGQVTAAITRDYASQQQQQHTPSPGTTTTPSTRSIAANSVDHINSQHAPLPSASTSLRARKLSLSTRNLPTTTSHQLTSPHSTTFSTTPTTTAPSPSDMATPDRSQVGLGLMLDDEGNSTSHSARSSFEGRGNDDDDESRDLLKSWGLEVQGGGASASSSSTSASSSVDAFESWPATKRSGASTSTTTQQRKEGNPIPRLSSTVTNSTSGTTASPLLIFTGSPNPSPSLSSTTSPRAFSPSPNRSPSPSHTAYNLPSSRSSTPSRITSQPMDRTGSSSKSRDIHGRQKSLTSACPPVTSSYSAEGGGGFAAGAYPPTSPQRGWKVYDWGMGRDKHGYSSDDEDPRSGAKGTAAGQQQSALGSLLALPSALLGFFLAPLSSPPSSSTSSHSSPSLNGSASPKGGASSANGSSSNSSKRQPLPVRLLLLAYLIFSALFFGLHLSSWAAGNEPNGAGAASKYLLVARGAEGGVGGVAAQWAQKVAEGVRWKGSSVGEMEVDEGGLDVRALGDERVEEWGLVRRLGVQTPDQRVAEQNPLSPLSHTYRFAKMHDKIHWDLHDEIVPYTFHASAIPAPNDITACLYSNEAWLSTLPSFLHAWDGPVSLVFEATHSRTSSQRAALLESIAALRESDDLVRKNVDFHVVGTPASMSERTLNKTRERMIERPMAQNFHVNLARFFAPTDMVFLVGDARVVPSPGLKRRLQVEAIRELVLERGDAVVVPTFGFIRDPTGDSNDPKMPSLHDLRAKLDLPLPSSSSSGAWSGVSASEFPLLAAEHILALHASLPLPPSQWPTKKQALVSMINTRLPSPDSPTSARLALFDRRWDLNHGPTNWYLWRKSSADPHLRDEPEAGGGVGLGVDGQVGGGRELYRVVDYDLHYAPNVVVSRKGQPWCTERFEQMQSACVYQMYLSGAEMWVLPDEWTFTVEVVEKKPEGWKEDPAEKLKNSISSRLYGKFHQEACMHYGREFLSIQMWNSEKAQHLRETCARTLSTWGMGLVARPAVGGT